MLPQFYSLNEYLNNTFGEKIYKLALNGGMSCPNRDGLIDTRGCIFCSAGGSGDFAGGAIDFTGEFRDSADGAIDFTRENEGFSAVSNSPIPGITEQIESAKALVKSKYSGKSYIAYFQAFTNTYASVDYLRRIFTEAINHPDIVCLSIATRPDCLDNEIIALIGELNTIKPVWVELGLQTIHERTAAYIRRGYPLSVFEHSVAMLNEANINTIVHMIIGLPYESKENMYATAKYLSRMNIQGVKLQLLHVLSGTDLADDYTNGLFNTLSLEEYINILSHIIELLPTDIVIHRITGDGPKSQLIAPLWSANKRNVLNSINREFKIHGIEQGKLFDYQK